MKRLESLIEAYGLMEGVDIWEREIDSTVEEIQKELLAKLENIAGMQGEGLADN